MNRSMLLWPAVGVALCAPTPAPGQDVDAGLPESMELVDRTVAVVGDTVVLYTEILESLIQLQAQGEALPASGTPAFDSLANRALRELVDQLVLLQRAKEDEIKISDDVLEAETDRRFREVRNAFPSATEFEKAIGESGRSLVQYRQFLRAQVRAQLMIEQFVQESRRNLPPVVVSDDEIRAWFDANLIGQTQPATVTFEQLVIEPKPSEEAEVAARERTVAILKEIREGKDFEIAAREYSEDSGTRDQGGDLRWVRRAQLDPDFSRAAWAARTGTPIGPVRTQFGHHIIKVENVRGGERKIRHVLIRHQITEADVQSARELAVRLADSIRGGASMQELAQIHGVKLEPVRVPEQPVDRLAELFPEYAQAIGTPVPGQVVGPFQVARGQRQVVVRILEFQSQGPYEFDQVRDDLRDRLALDKAYERFVADLRQQIHVDLKL